MSSKESRLKVSSGASPTKDSIIIYPVFSDQKPADISTDLKKPALKKILEKQTKAGAFKAKAGETLNLVQENVILAGLGKKSSFHPDAVAALFRSMGSMLAKMEAEEYFVHFSSIFISAIRDFDRLWNEGGSTPQKKSSKQEEEVEEEEPPVDYTLPLTAEEMISQAVSCLYLGFDSMEVLKSRKKKKEKEKSPDVRVFAAGMSGAALKSCVERGEKLGTFANRVRYIASLPGNHFHPAEFEKYAKETASTFGLKIKVFQEADLKKMGCGGILSVGKGSEIPPRMIVLEYMPASSKENPLVLVGKGITFDTGGISLKPPAEMHEMKYDMCGAALVINAVSLAAHRKIKRPVVGLIGIAENMPDGRAIKPGDVYTAYNGLTVEVQNTDAEGRLVLGDVLAYACDKYKPEFILDFATLTGACVIALGHEAAGVMTSSEELWAKIDISSRKSLDRVWRMPHWQIYSAGLRSDTADLRNIAGRDAGTVTAYRFLSRFVKNGVRWAHFDIAGTAWRGKDRGSQTKGATGWGVRFLNQLMEDVSGGN